MSGQEMFSIGPLLYDRTISSRFVWPLILISSSRSRAMQLGRHGGPKFSLVLLKIITGGKEREIFVYFNEIFLPLMENVNND